MDRPPPPRAPLDRHLLRATALLGSLVFVGAVVLSVATNRPLVAVYAAGACAAGICYLLALLWISRRM